MTTIGLIAAQNIVDRGDPHRLDFTRLALAGKKVWMIDPNVGQPNYNPRDPAFRSLVDAYDVVFGKKVEQGFRDAAEFDRRSAARRKGDGESAEDFAAKRAALAPAGLEGGTPVPTTIDEPSAAGQLEGGTPVDSTV